MQIYRVQLSTGKTLVTRAESLESLVGQLRASGFVEDSERKPEDEFWINIDHVAVIQRQPDHTGGGAIVGFR